MLKERNWNNNVDDRGNKLTKLVLRNITITGVVLPLFNHLDVIRNPCMPAYFGGYWIVEPQCGGQIGTDFQATWSIYEILTKSVVCFVSYINLSFLVSGSFFHITTVLLTQPYCLKNYILLAGQKIDESLRGQGKTNWRTWLVYREVELMSTEYRNLYSYYMTAVVMICVIFQHIITLYACLEFGMKLPLPSYLLFLITTVNDGVVLVGMYSTLSNIFTTSQDILEKQLRLATGKTAMSPYFRRYHKSCKILKVYIGSSNFVEPLTPLVVEEFCIQQVISLLLL